MNREQRRQQVNRGMTATPIDPIKQMKIQYGHDDKGHVVVTFNQPVRNLLLTPEQTDAMIDGLKVCMGKLAEYEKEHPRG